MKIRLISAVFCLFAMYFSASADDWAQFGIYENQNRQVCHNPKAVFLGNSITEGWMNLHPGFFTSNNFLGRGISGQTSYQMLLRFRDDVINLHPEYVVICCGTNDIAENNHTYNEERTFGNIVSMCELAKANGIGVILASVPPADKFGWRLSIENVPEKITGLNDLIWAYARSNDIPYVDYYAGLADDDGAMNPLYTEDGVHPNSEGYEVMEKIIMAVIPCLQEPLSD